MSTTAGPMPPAITIRVSYVLRSEVCRSTFLELMAELRRRTLEVLQLVDADPTAYSMAESADRSGWFDEAFLFASRQQHERFDDLYTQDRPVATIQALLEETIDSARCDYVVTRSVG